MFARNEMAVTDPEGIDLGNKRVADEMIMESTIVVDDVTALTEKWKELALIHWEVNPQTAIWVIQVTTIKTDLRMLQVC